MNHFENAINTLKEVSASIPKAEVINYFNDNNIDYFNKTDIEMYIIYLEYLNTTPNITFEQCDDNSDKYTFSYLCTKNGVLVECGGYMEPYFSGRAIEHNVVIDDSENMEDDDLNNTAQEVEDEIFTAFYNHFTK